MNYDQFFGSVQAYSEEVLRLISGIRNSATIMRRVTYSMIDEAGYTHIVDVWKQANYIDERSLHIVERTRQVFWPRDLADLGDLDTFHEINHMRWHPFDKTAWEIIIADLSGVVLPWLRDIDAPLTTQATLIEQEIDAWLRFGVPDKLRMIKQVSTNIQRNCQRVRRTLDPTQQRKYLRSV